MGESVARNRRPCMHKTHHSFCITDSTSNWHAVVPTAIVPDGDRISGEIVRSDGPSLDGIGVHIWRYRTLDR